MSIKVDDTSTWPNDVLEALRSRPIRRHFKQVEWADDAYEIPTVREIGDALVRRCYASGLVGYHCTKEKYPGFFKQHGLEPTEPERRINAFLDEFGGRLAENKLREVRAKFDEWLGQRGQMRGREGKVWFCLTGNAVVGPGTERFFRYYGGEIIYWPFSGRDTEVEALLESIGSPAVVEASLDPSELEYFGDWNLAKSMLSYYGLSVNPSFNPHDIEGYMKVPLPPNRIVEVHPQADFFEANIQITPS